MLTTEEQNHVENLKAKLEILEPKLARLLEADSNSYTSQVARSFHLGMVGGSGRNTHRLNKKREREIDKTIQNAKDYLQLIKQVNQIKGQIKYIESGQKIKDSQKKASRNELLAEWFKSLKPGDTIQPGNDKITITKANKKSVVTENNCKWTAAELIGNEAAKLL